MLPKRTILLLLSLPCLAFLLIKGHQSRLEPAKTFSEDEDHTEEQPVDFVDFPNPDDELEAPKRELEAAVTENVDKTIFVITPTYTRPTQMPDMTRIAQTLEWASVRYGRIFWIVSEDATEVNPQISSLLNRTSVPSVHLLGPRPVTHLDKRSGRGVSNRLRGLKWLRDTFNNTSQEGVIYFADDDNSYDIRVFKEIKETKKVSVFPVGLIAKVGVSSPVINLSTGLIESFHDPFMTRRKFAVDMAGFAVDLQLFLSKPKATMPYKVGYEEDFFIRSLGVKMSELEPKANNCTEVLVWHTKTLPGVFPSVNMLQKNKSFELTNLPQLYQNVLPTNVTSLSPTTR